MCYSSIICKGDLVIPVPRNLKFKSHEIFRNLLFNVLKAQCIQYPDIGNCQGMNFLTMRIL